MMKVNSNSIAGAREKELDVVEQAADQMMEALEVEASKSTKL